MTAAVTIISNCHCLVARTVWQLYSDRYALFLLLGYNPLYHKRGRTGTIILYYCVHVCGEGEEWGWRYGFIIGCSALYYTSVSPSIPESGRATRFDFGLFG